MKLLNLFNSKRAKRNSAKNKNAEIKNNHPGNLRTAGKIKSVIDFQAKDYITGRYKYNLYRFLESNVPVVNACLTTWTRLSSAPGKFVADDSGAQNCLDNLSGRLYQGGYGNRGNLITFMTEVFNGMYRDGLFGGFITVKKDGSGVDRFIPIDVSNLNVKKHKLYLEIEERSFELNGDDFYFIPLNGNLSHPLGNSILNSVPFVTYIEQQLIDDMRRANRNAGYNRLHVKITPPERMAGESDKIYYDRINSYFDSTLSMIKSCEVDENPVTWDNIVIESVGPKNVRAISNSWFMNHRAMIEEVCAGTGLAPFLLGYSYGATTSWSAFKFDIVMRQVHSIQSEVAAFMEWIGNIELALAGYSTHCQYEFDNAFTYREIEQAEIRLKETDSILKLYQAGLIDEAAAKEKAGRLI